MRATVCGHHVRQRNDEKLADLRSETLIMWDKSPSPPRSVLLLTLYARTVSCVLPLSGALPSGGYTVTVTVTASAILFQVLTASL